MSFLTLYWKRKYLKEGFMSPAQEELPVQKTSRALSLSHPAIFFSLFLLLVVLGTVGYIFLSPQGREPTEEKESHPHVDRILASGKIVIGTDATYAPMEFTDDTTGELKGYDIDLGNKIAEELGVDAEFKNIPWSELGMDPPITSTTSALLRNEVDVVISSVTITDERKQTYDFSQPYINAGQVIVTKKDNSSISSTADLKGKKIAVQKGTTNEEQALIYTDSDLVLLYENFNDATEALLTGKADAIFTDLTNAKGAIDEYKDLKIASDPFTSEFYGVVFRKGETDLVQSVNEVLNLLRQRGVEVFLKQKWLE